MVGAGVCSGTSDFRTAQKSGGSPTLVVTGATFSLQINQSVVGDRVFVLTGATYPGLETSSWTTSLESKLHSSPRLAITKLLQTINRSSITAPNSFLHSTTAAAGT